ncbi:MAG: 4Fe-4S dicluster domain-containing protein [Planctomycetota bacterium]
MDRTQDENEGAARAAAEELLGAPEPAIDRRELLTGGAAALAAGALAPEAHADDRAQGLRSDLFMPEEHWRERMTAPDDGKRYGWVVDTRRCFGCHACEVACKAENDVPLGNYIRQTIYHDLPRPADARVGAGQFARIMVPMACQHCEDAPCIKACPCGALHKGAGGSVQVNYDKCSGHASCKEACPYGAIYIDPVANQAVKCHNCTHRVEVGMEPACVATCPSEALHFGDLADPESRVSQLKAELEGDGKLQRLREDKGTEPRMWFAIDETHRAERWAAKVPAEGESYHPDAYSVYEWQEPTPPHARIPHPAEAQRERELGAAQDGASTDTEGSR